jgi:pyruvate dehydrogenase E2 component (dihydrolipoamide acetyltransferase)
MPTNVLMPALSPTMEKGNLARWLKQEGDTIKSGDVIAEIETDKATMEVEAVDEGTLAKILVPEGTADVPVNQPIAVIAAEGEDVKAAAGAAAKLADTKQEAKAGGASFETPAARAPQDEGKQTPAARAPQDEGKQTPATRAPQDEGIGPEVKRAPQKTEPHPEERAHARVSKDGPQAQANRIFASPLARRLAKEASIELQRVQGSGPHGRIIARDIEQAKSGKGLRPPSAAPAAGAVAPSIALAMSDQQVLALFEEGSYELVPHDNMRRTIAQRLAASAQTIPHFYLTIDCDIGKLIAAREEINAAAPKDKEGKPAYKLSVNDFVIKAFALALQRIPDANVSWTEAGLLKHKHSDIGVAVALPGGLITPIVRNAETKSLSAISNEMRDLSGRARARKLKPNEYQGGSSAVSNLGMYGIKDFTAVINPPHATILAVGAGEERAVVRNGKIEAAQIMSVTMSCDHRAVDGALGAELIGAFKRLVENPVMMVV